MIMSTGERIVRGTPTGAWTSRHHRWEPVSRWWPEGLPPIDTTEAQPRQPLANPLRPGDEGRPSVVDGMEQSHNPTRARGPRARGSRPARPISSVQVPRWSVRAKAWTHLRCDLVPRSRRSHSETRECTHRVWTGLVKSITTRVSAFRSRRRRIESREVVVIGAVLSRLVRVCTRRRFSPS